MSRTFSWSLVTILSALLVGACSQTHELTPGPALGEAVSATIDARGGDIELGGIVLAIPPGALAASTTITVTAIDASPPSWLTPSSPILRFEPEGLTFAEPIELRIPFTGDADTATVFWSAREGGVYVARSTRVEGNVAIAESSHFSQAFVGSACEGDDCCGRANGVLDVLLAVDNSHSMSEEQAALQVQLPRLARVLASGDVDGDGVQDFPALDSVRIGVVSSDMGSGGHPLPTCDGGTLGAAFGDDGRLRTSGMSALAGCASSYPSFAELSADSDPATVDAFVTQVGCVATTGVGGCGFEQPLEAVLKATTPSTAAITFHDSTTGHADGANAGFLRSDSMLAVVLLTDEDDCSAADAEVFDPASPTYGGSDLNLRCFVHPAAAHSTDRYVDGLLALRANPADVIFATVAGAPPSALAESADLDALLAHTSMIEQVDPTMPNRLTPSCNDPGTGIALPPRRIVQVARDLEDAGAHAVVTSICQSDFTPVMDAILSRVAARSRGECR